jgi:hypothetical protein
MLTPAELRRATAEAARRLGARGLSARAEGATLSCTFPSGAEIVLHNRCEPDGAYDRELLLDNMAAAVLSAALARGARG